LVGAPKKAKKITFTDPFIYHALKHWLNSEAAITPYEQICLDVANPAIASELVESVVSNQFRRYYPTYYIKADSGEVDVAYVEKQSFYPIEVKWRNQLRPADIKKLSKYPDIRVFAKTYADGEINNIRVEPLPLALLRSDR
jgi:predicted AAA+ superfamily ATPase